MARRRKPNNPKNETMILSVDTSQWEERAKQLTSKELFAATRSGFRRGVAVLRSSIQKEIRATTRSHRSGVKVWTIRGYYYPRAIWRDVKISVFRTIIGANVSLCNPKNPDNRAYILRMLNGGTERRVTKKHVNRGSLRSLDFFENGVNRAKDKASREVEKKIIKAVFDKKYD